MPPAQPPHCCEGMRHSVEYVCDMHPEFGSCHDYLFGYSPTFDEYQLLIHDGESNGASETVQVIRYCPYCGTKFPPSRRGEWFNLLEARNIDMRDAPDEISGYGWWLRG